MARSKPETYHVPPELHQQTLPAALRRFRPGDSWSQVRTLLKSRHVLVNGNLCLDAGRRLKTGDVVQVSPHALAPLPTLEDVVVRYLDPHVVVVEKPSGITTVRHAEERFWPERRKQQQPTLDELLPRVIERERSPASAPQAPRTTRGRSGAAAARRPGPARRPARVRPVHRLDRETSGLMVFARTPEAEQALVQQFRKHTVHRKYLAIVCGDVAEQTITTNLVRDRGDGRRGSTNLPDVGQRAVTHVRPVERLGDYTLVECRLETGRTHQIRIHLAERGHLVCGEKLYHQPLFDKPLVDRSGAPRIALHAAELGFRHPVTGEELHFQMPLPPDLQEFLNRLRKAHRAQAAAARERKA